MAEAVESADDEEEVWTLLSGESANRLCCWFFCCCSCNSFFSISTCCSYSAIWNCCSSTLARSIFTSFSNKLFCLSASATDPNNTASSCDRSGGGYGELYIVTPEPIDDADPTDNEADTDGNESEFGKILDEEGEKDIEPTAVLLEEEDEPEAEDGRNCLGLLLVPLFRLCR
jgi:hypothetical protein